MEGAVGIEGVLPHDKPERILSIEIGERHASGVSGDDRMNDEVGQRSGVMLASEGQRSEVSFRWWLYVFTIQNPVAGAGQLVVVLSRSCSRGGVPSTPYPAHRTECRQTLTNHSFAAERMNERLAQFEDLPSREYGSVKGGQYLHIAPGENAARMSCHRLPSNLPFPESFPDCMAEQNRAFINVDELVQQATVEQVASYYGVAPLELKRIGEETRTRCFLNCGKTQETGDRALAIQENHPAKQWQCHQYGCGKNGNLIGLMDLLKPGENMGGRPRGDRFKQIAADLRAIIEGHPALQSSPRVVMPERTPPPKINVPLAESENERARGLTNLDAKFITDPARMPPAAASYVRRRPFLSSEVCKQWRMGYLPRDVGGEDNSGGTMRGKIVYGYPDEDGNIVTWFGRDPEFEEKIRDWEATGKNGREPEKFHFVKGFHRGLELYGQHRLSELEALERIERHGLFVVEGTNDVIALDALGITAVGLCSNTITSEQADKLAWYAKELGGGKVTVMLDCDAEGENGAKQAIYEIGQRCHVRVAWSSGMHEGKYAGRQPESLKIGEWQIISANL